MFEEINAALNIRDSILKPVGDRRTLGHVTEEKA